MSVDNRPGVVDNPPNLVDILNQADVPFAAAADSGDQLRTKHDSTPAVGSTGGAPIPPPPVESLRRVRRTDPTSSLSERVLWHAYGLDGLEK
jgi:hypothetical protein